MLGTEFGRYRIKDTLGQGGMGVVYLAEDTRLGRDVAIKTPSGPGSAGDQWQEVLREARVASGLSHPNIATIHDCGEHDGKPYIVMELVAGQSLAGLLKSGPLQPEYAVRIVAQVLLALGEAHRRGIVHRDIKPANIRINERGEVKVLDFGLARKVTRVAAATVTLDHLFAGTPGYASPEQARGEAAESSDIFAAGAVLYECLTGRPAFRGGSAIDVLSATLNAHPEPPSRVRPGLPAGLDAVVLRSLAKDPAARYASALEMRDALLAVAAVASPAVKTGPRPSRRVFAVRAGAVAAAVAVLAALWLLLPARRYKPSPEALRWYQEGTNAIRDATYYKASKALERAVRMDSGFHMARAALAEAWNELDSGGRAREELLRVTSGLRSPARQEALYVDALQKTLTGDFTGATLRFQEIAGRAAEADKPAALVDLARAWERGDRTGEAIANYREAARRRPQFAAAFLRLGILYARQQESASAASALSEAEALYRSSSNLEGVAEVLHQRGVLASRMGRTEEADRLLNQALELARTAGSAYQQVRVLLQQANVDARKGDTAQAEAHASAALELARANGFENLTARGLIDLGNAYFLRGGIPQARKYYSQAAGYAGRNRAQSTEARALLSLGSLEIQVRELDPGLRNVEAALAYYRQAGYRREVAQGLVLLGRARRDRGDYDGAAAAFEQQADVARKLGDARLSEMAQQGLGAVRLRQERLPEALSAYRSAYESGKTGKDRLSSAYSGLGCAQALAGLGRLSEARAMLDEIRDAARAPGGFAAFAWDIGLAEARLELAERRTAAALLRLRKLLAVREALTADLLAQVLSAYGAASVQSGSARAGLAAVEEALAIARRLEDPGLISAALLDRASALAAEGQRRSAAEAASEARAVCAAKGQKECEWRALALAARASGSRDLAGQAMDALNSLERFWNPGDFRTYLARADVRALQTDTARLKGADR